MGFLSPEPIQFNVSEGRERKRARVGGMEGKNSILLIWVCRMGIVVGANRRCIFRWVGKR
jgi:hypothetical protein